MEGAQVALLDRSAEGLDRAAQQIGSQSSTVLADVRDPSAVEAAVASAAKSMGGIDGVVNAAGISLWRSLEETSHDEWRNVMSINLDGPFHVCKAVIAELKKAGRGTIVNIASGAAFRQTPNFGAYCTSKAALVMMTKVLAAELVGLNIRANSICPGVIYTPMVERTLSGSTDRKQRTAQYFERQGMKRFGTVEEIAKLALFLTGPDSSFTTGSAYSADGGSVYH
ncbi:hypothetical protein CQ13_10690 [Bradyrhizobium retamae]|uniref:Short-chain dehydrogenase n=1 Tax=Bradyrhizobium retamae TaxID=1300035 RepID=A0A0R3MBZ0_9BRAD|nr:hypothetical protein CQ13_10690 [Bradyrhizobium retamae]